MQNKLKVIIIVPEYNEGLMGVGTIEKILKKTKNDLVVVDDGSKNDSYNLLLKAFGNNSRVTLVKHQQNKGKGAAMKTGVDVAWKSGADAVIFIDADGQHNPSHLRRFEKALTKYKIVFGYRLLGSDVPKIRKWGNIFASKLIKFLFNIKKKDLLSGYLGFRKEVYSKIEWQSSRYGIETEMATKIGKSRLPFKEIKIDTIYIDKYKGVNLFDAFKILCQIPRWYFNK